ncbi:hypothetical protein HDU97_001820 [Phlyctochytrium planicorne]|nr:hypothetical protein HDU97_001820 [Phlyctochytrium planicorne]
MPPLDDFELEDDEDSGPAVNGEVTRCVCGLEDELGGMMIQCDKCNVWQHCECMGIFSKKMPKHYYCEKCRPTNHPYFKLVAKNAAAAAASGGASASSASSGAVSRASHSREGSNQPSGNAASSSSNSASHKNSNNNSNQNAPGKKRNTMNSRDAAQTFSEILPLINGKSGSAGPSSAGADGPDDDLPATTSKSQPEKQSSSSSSSSSSSHASQENTRSNSPTPSQSQTGTSSRRARAARNGGSRKDGESPIAMTCSMLTRRADEKGTTATSATSTASGRNGLSTPVSSEEDLAGKYAQGSNSKPPAQSKRKRGAPDTKPASSTRPTKALKTGDVASPSVEDDDGEDNESQGTPPPNAAEDGADGSVMSSTEEDIVKDEDGVTDAREDAGSPSKNDEKWEEGQTVPSLNRRPSSASVSSKKGSKRSHKQSFPEEDEADAASESQLETGSQNGRADETPKAASKTHKTKKAKKDTKKKDAKGQQATSSAPSATTTAASAAVAAPPKPKPLNPKMSINDMRKRVQAISDYLERQQVNLAEEAAAPFPYFEVGVFPMTRAPGFLAACTPEIAAKVRQMMEAEKAHGGDGAIDERPTASAASYLPTPPLSSTAAPSADVTASAPSPVAPQRVVTPPPTLDEIQSTLAAVAAGSSTLSTTTTTSSTATATVKTEASSTAIATTTTTSTTTTATTTTSTSVPDTAVRTPKVSTKSTDLIASTSSSLGSPVPPSLTTASAASTHPSSDSEDHTKTEGKDELIYLASSKIVEESKGKKRTRDEEEEEIDGDEEEDVRSKKTRRGSDVGASAETEVAPVVAAAPDVEVPAVSNEKRETSFEIFVKLTARIAAFQAKYGAWPGKK